VLGDPSVEGCPCNGCEGCKIEVYEATTSALIALGYLDPPKYKLVEDDGHCKVYDFDGPQPDVELAYDKFMEKEVLS